ncbi:MAG: hypothetical protein QXI93_04895 [Candidatus Methanomethylicia archaeon]
MKINYIYMPILISILLITFCFWLIPFVSNFILLIFLVEVASAATFYLTFIVLTLWNQSRSIDLESTFMCGLAKPPYIALDEIYIFNMPFMEVEKDEH